MNTELVKSEAPVDSSLSMMAILQRAASDPSCDVNKAERFLDMALKMKALEAEQEFNKAMAACQAEMPAVFRDANNPSTNSRYTRLESLHAVVVPVTTKHGFSMSFGTADCPTPGHYRVTCHVAHASGHARDYQLDLANDNLGPKGLPNKTLLHGAGSSMSYGRRYLTMMIFNVALTNEDDDGNKGGQKPAQAPGQATAKSREFMLSQFTDIQEEAFNFAVEHGWLAPDDKLTDWPLEHVPLKRSLIEQLKSEIKEWAKQ